jgi:hypothetical protein
MMDHKGLMNEPSSKIDDLYRREPLAHERDYLWTDTNIDWETVAENRQRVIDNQNVELIDMRSELAKIGRNRDRWMLMAVALGVGLGFLVGLMVFR